MGSQPSAATARECKGSTPLSDDRSRSARATLRSSQRENPGQQRKTAAATAEEQPRRSNESEIVTGRRSASFNQLRKTRLHFALKGGSFRCAVTSPLFCHPSPTLVGEGSAFRLFPQPVKPCPFKSDSCAEFLRSLTIYNLKT